MAKGQKKSGREPKKPKAGKATVSPGSALARASADRPMPTKGQGK